MKGIIEIFVILSPRLFVSTEDCSCVLIPERTCPTCCENTCLLLVVCVVVNCVPPETLDEEVLFLRLSTSTLVGTLRPYQLSCQLFQTVPVTPASCASSRITSKLLSSFTTTSGRRVTSFQSSEYGVRIISPLNGATLYGLVSKLSDAYGFLMCSTSVYGIVIIPSTCIT